MASDGEVRAKEQGSGLANCPGTAGSLEDEQLVAGVRFEFAEVAKVAGVESKSAANGGSSSPRDF
jgi:hypothetical protein